MTDRFPLRLELVTGADGGLKRLRRLFLSLALEGRFTQTVASELADQTSNLCSLNELRVKHARRGRVSRLQPAAYNSAGVERLTNGWPLLVASDFFLTRSGNSKLIKGKLLDHPAADTYPGFSASGQDVWLDTFEHEGEAVVVSAVGARCGKAFSATGRWSAIANTHIVWPITELISLEFAMLWLNDEAFWLRAGGAQPFIKTTETLSRLISLPPLGEQHRIVAKVDELMALCDRLEARQQDAEAAHTRLVQALLDRLTQARDADEFQACWQRVAGGFPKVFQTSVSVDALQLSLYELAISGRLVEQRSEEEPASVALHNIREAKRRAVQPDAPARTKVAPDRETPAADLPLGWEHARFADIAFEVATGPFGSLIHQSDYQHGGVPLINPSHMVGGRIVADPCVALPPEKAQELSAYRLNEGDMVMARRGEVGRVALVSAAEHGWLCGTGSFRLRFTGDVHASFIRLLFQAPSVRRYLAGAAVGTTMVNLNHGVLAKLPVDLPPLAEQRRIVAKVTELLALCDQLKARIAAARAKHAQLAEALVAQAAAG